MFLQVLAFSRMFLCWQGCRSGELVAIVASLILLLVFFPGLCWFFLPPRPRVKKKGGGGESPCHPSYAFVFFAFSSSAFTMCILHCFCFLFSPRTQWGLPFFVHPSQLDFHIRCVSPAWHSLRPLRTDPCAGAWPSHTGAVRTGPGSSLTACAAARALQEGSV